jgi:hypothetical protein
MRFHSIPFHWNIHRRLNVLVTRLRLTHFLIHNFKEQSYKKHTKSFLQTFKRSESTRIFKLQWILISLQKQLWLNNIIKICLKICQLFCNRKTVFLLGYFELYFSRLRFIASWLFVVGTSEVLSIDVVQNCLFKTS